jgi:hypothetical protein
VVGIDDEKVDCLVAEQARKRRQGSVRPFHDQLHVKVAHKWVTGACPVASIQPIRSRPNRSLCFIRVEGFLREVKSTLFILS